MPHQNFLNINSKTNILTNSDINSYMPIIQSISRNSCNSNNKNRFDTMINNEHYQILNIHQRANLSKIRKRNDEIKINLSPFKRKINNHFKNGNG